MAEAGYTKFSPPDLDRLNRRLQRLNQAKESLDREIDEFKRFCEDEQWTPDQLKAMRTLASGGIIKEPTNG